MNEYAMSPLWFEHASSNYVVCHQFLPIENTEIYIAIATPAFLFALSRINNCYSLLLGTTHGIKYRLLPTRNSAARVILRIPKLVNITTFVKITSFDSYQCKKYLRNRLFLLPLSQQYCDIISIPDLLR